MFTYDRAKNDWLAHTACCVRPSQSNAVQNRNFKAMKHTKGNAQPYYCNRSLAQNFMCGICGQKFAPAHTPMRRRPFPDKSRRKTNLHT